MNPWLIFGTTIVSLAIIGPTACTIHSNQVVSDMVQAGASPTEAKCAIRTTYEKSEATCVTAALLRSLEEKMK